MTSHGIQTILHKNNDFVAEMFRFSGKGAANKPTSSDQNRILPNVGLLEVIWSALVHLLLSLGVSGAAAWGSFHLLSLEFPWAPLGSLGLP